MRSPQSDLTPWILTLPKGLINITQEGDLTVISKIDREDSKINDLNGVLWYNVTVFDNANNRKTLEVCCLGVCYLMVTASSIRVNLVHSFFI